MAPTLSPEKQLAGFIDKFTPENASLIRAVRRKMRALLPDATEIVYDNYNFFVIGYGPTDRPSDAVFSIAAQAKGVSLCFLQGASLPDPHKILRGGGNVVRNVKLESAATLESAEVRALIDAARVRSKKPFDGEHRLIIRSVSAKQRPRRPVEKSTKKKRAKTKRSPPRR